MQLLFHRKNQCVPNAKLSRSRRPTTSGFHGTRAYDAVKTGQSPTIELGKRLLVPKVALDRMLKNAATAAA
jgi:hypothetical protein